MNFRSFKYFLTVCEMGTINAAARKLYISQQSLSQHIKKMETEVGAQLFHRDNPLVLTQAGKCVYRAAKTVMETLDRMEQEVADCSGARAVELTIGMIDYGTPDFFAPLAELFIKKEPQVLILTRELYSGDPIPTDVPLFLSPRELGGNYRSELLFCDRLVVCVADSLLKKRYPDWRQRKERLRQGDISALEGCPFLRHVDTPLQDITEMAFEQNHFQPCYLPVMGKVSTMTRLCADGQAAMTSLQNAMKDMENLPGYLVGNVPEQIPAGYICYEKDTVLSGPAARFLEITRHYFKRKEP